MSFVPEMKLEKILKNSLDSQRLSCVTTKEGLMQGPMNCPGFE